MLVHDVEVENVVPVKQLSTSISGESPKERNDEEGNSLNVSK